MPFTNRTRVVLTDNEQYEFTQLIELQQTPVNVPADPGAPPQAPLPYVLHGYGVGANALIIEQVLSTPVYVGHTNVIQLQLNTGDVIETTPEQEFYLELGIPTQAKNLRVGDRPLVQMGGEIEIMHVEQLNGTQDVYSLSAVKTGNFMLASGVLVAALP